MKTLYAVFTIVLVFGIIFFSLRVMKTEAPGGPLPEVTYDAGGGSRVRAPEDLSLKVGESGVALGGLGLTFNALVNDYRCPTDVVCIEAGAVNTNITVSEDDETQTLNYSSDGIPLGFEGYTISIIGVSPNAHSEKTIPQAEYSVTFHIESMFVDTIDTGSPVADADASCTERGGNWDPTYQECLGIDASACSAIGGNFSECASACRNDPTAEVCTTQCVQVCDIGPGDK